LPAGLKRLDREFALRDRNGDGSVTWNELLALNDLLPSVLHEGMDAEASFLRVDANLDGVFSLDEFLADDHKSNDNEYLRLKQRVFRIRDLDGDKTLSFLEFVQTGENPARQFVRYDRNADGVILFEDLKGIRWVTGQNSNRDRCYFARLDENQDRRVTWKEYRNASPRGIAFGAIDRLDINNSISKEEWDAVRQEYLEGQEGKRGRLHEAWSYAAHWFPGVFDLITFGDVDSDKDEMISWNEFSTFPN
jgi:Ca2+-binding EF-hand superfamily protein